MWHSYCNDFPKSLRYTLGGKIENIFLSALESLFTAKYQQKNEKLPTILYAMRKIDLLKFFLYMSWDLKALDNKKYATISEKVEEIGRMVGGWKKGLEPKTPPTQN